MKIFWRRNKVLWQKIWDLERMIIELGDELNYDYKIGIREAKVNDYKPGSDSRFGNPTYVTTGYMWLKRRKGSKK